MCVAGVLNLMCVTGVLNFMGVTGVINCCKHQTEKWKKADKYWM